MHAQYRRTIREADCKHSRLKKQQKPSNTTQCSALFQAGVLCHLANWACCHWTTHWHFVSFVQNILHNVSRTHTHTYLLTVPNTVGSVSSLSLTDCQATISSGSTVFFFLAWARFSQSISPVSLMPFLFLFFLFLSLSLSPSVAWRSTCLPLALLLFDADKVTHHRGLNYGSNQSWKPKQLLGRFWKARLS